MKSLLFRIALVAVTCAACAGPGLGAQAVPGAAPIVGAPAGSLKGLHEGNANVFRAIPYALPPIAERRWRPPAPMPRWKGVRPAQAMGVACMQPPMSAGPYDRGKVPMAEDCLTLDVTAPVNARNAPVMVWIHGGTLIWGSGHSEMYDGRGVRQTRCRPRLDQLSPGRARLPGAPRVEQGVPRRRIGQLRAA
jgi:para-nitrobenzyl esterase